MARILLACACSLLVLAGCVTAPRGQAVSVPGGTYRLVSPDELAQMLKSKDFFLVNVKVPYSGEIRGTDAFISANDTAARIGEYPRDRKAKIVIYCLSGRTSVVAARALVKAGYTDVAMLEGGILAWKKAGYEVEDRSAKD